MTTFALLAAALAALVLILVLRPLLFGRGGETLSRDKANVAIYRDQLRELETDLAAGTLAQADYERARREIEARLLEDVAGSPAGAERRSPLMASIALGVGVPLVAVAVYLAAGNPRGLDPVAATAPDAAEIESMLGRLNAKLRENPDDAEGWKLLGRSYSVLGRYQDAVGAFAKAAERQPDDAQLLADFADVLAMARGQKLVGEPEQLVQRALKVDPKNLKALALAGTAAFERQDYRKAAEIWSRMLPLVPPGSEDARMVADNVEEARKLAGIGSSAKEVPGDRKVAGDGRGAKAHPGVRGTVRLAAPLAKEVKPDDVLYIFARAAEGPPAPLAVLRARASELPLSFSLDDSLAMAPGMAISAHSRIVVTARVAKSGGVKPLAGDLEGASAPVPNDAAGVNVLIDRVLK